MAQLFVLFEHASGYGLFRVQEFEEVGTFLPQVEAAVADASKFRHVVKLVAFRAFTSAASALANINAVSEGLLTEELSAFLETNLPKSKKGGVQLGVCDPKLASSISEALAYPVTHTGVVPEVLRGIRTHLASFVKGLTSVSMKQTELGLGHSYSRGKVKFNVNRVDNMIIQSIALVDQLDKDVNTFAMRIKEWYSYHFPELARLVPENYPYSLCAYFIKDRHTLTEESLPKLEEILMDSVKAQAILDASRMSMGMDISPIDLVNIERFAKRVIGLSEYRMQLAEYLKTKMSMVAPNLATLIGEVVGARLISHAGSLTSLAKYPASTVQILGAEKALFRAIKTRSNTPKYGLIFHSSFIGRAGTANKGRISRYLANKCSIATRIDCFSETLTTVFGEHLREQVEERLKFYETGTLPRKNVEVMSEALGEHIGQLNSQKRKADQLDVSGDAVSAGEPPKKKKKKKNEEAQEAVEAVEEPVEEEEGEKKKKKKKKKNEMEQAEEVAAAAEPEPEEEPATTPKKKKKKKKDVEMDGEAVQVNGGEAEVAGEAETPKKKKKKKQEQLDEAINGALEEAQMEMPEAGSEEIVKKKKKKKKHQVEQEV